MLTTAYWLLSAIIQIPHWMDCLVNPEFLVGKNAGKINVELTLIFKIIPILALQQLAGI